MVQGTWIYRPIWMSVLSSSRGQQCYFLYYVYLSTNADKSTEYQTFKERFFLLEIVTYRCITGIHFNWSNIHLSLVGSIICLDRARYNTYRFLIWLELPLFLSIVRQAVIFLPDSIPPGEMKAISIYYVNVLLCDLKALYANILPCFVYLFVALISFNMMGKFWNNLYYQSLIYMSFI